MPLTRPAVGGPNLHYTDPPETQKSPETFATIGDARHRRNSRRRLPAAAFRSVFDVAQLGIIRLVVGILEDA